MRAIILYATETGNAEMLAEDIAAHIGSGDVRAENMADADASIFSEDALFLIVSSTYGEGELPSTARAFHAALLAQKPDLKHVRFAVFGMGDQGTYPDTFAHGGRIWTETLAGLGARQVGERVAFDASSALLAEEVALPWVDGILAMIE